MVGKLCNNKQSRRPKTVGTGTDENPQFSKIDNPTNAALEIADTKLYIPVITLSTENDKKLLNQLRIGFKRAIKWNKYRSEMTNQTQNNNLNYLTDLSFTKVNRLFVLLFEKKKR